jgi:hypothetical protein
MNYQYILKYRLLGYKLNFNHITFAFVFNYYLMLVNERWVRTVV